MKTTEAKKDLLQRMQEDTIYPVWVYGVYAFNGVQYYATTSRPLSRASLRAIFFSADDAERFVEQFNEARSPERRLASSL